MRAQGLLSRASGPAVSSWPQRLMTMQGSAVQPARIQLHSHVVHSSATGSSLFARHSAYRGVTCRGYSNSGSNSSSSSTSTPQAAPILLRLGRALLRAAIALVAAALLTAAALPAALSTQAGLQNAVRLANCFTSAQISVSQVRPPAMP